MNTDELESICDMLQDITTGAALFRKISPEPDPGVSGMFHEALMVAVGKAQERLARYLDITVTDADGEIVGRLDTGLKDEKLYRDGVFDAHQTLQTINVHLTNALAGGEGLNRSRMMVRYAQQLVRAVGMRMDKILD